MVRPRHALVGGGRNPRVVERVDNERRDADRGEEAGGGVVRIVLSGSGVAVARADEAVVELEDGTGRAPALLLLGGQRRVAVEAFRLDMAAPVDMIDTASRGLAASGGRGEGQARPNRLPWPR